MFSLLPVEIMDKLNVSFPKFKITLNFDRCSAHLRRMAAPPNNPARKQSQQLLRLSVITLTRENRANQQSRNSPWFILLLPLAVRFW